MENKEIHIIGAEGIRGKNVVIVGGGIDVTRAAQRIRELGCKVIIVDNMEDIPEEFKRPSVLLIKQDDIPPQPVIAEPIPFKMLKREVVNIELYHEDSKSKYIGNPKHNYRHRR